MPQPDRPAARIAAAPVAARDWARQRRSTHLALKAVVAVVGVSLVLAGVVMLVLPGPGWAAILLGLVVLASEFEPAARLRDRLAAALRSGMDRVRRRRSTNEQQQDSEGVPSPVAAGHR